MLRAFILSILIISFSAAKSQGKVSFAVIGEYSENLTLSNYSGGVQLEIPLKNDRFTLNYKATLGTSSNYTTYVHLPMGISATFLLLSVGGGTSDGSLFYLCLLPDGITFYPKPDAKIKLGLVLNPFSSDYWHEYKRDEHFRFSGEAGVKVKVPLSPKYLDLLMQSGVKVMYGTKKIDPYFLYVGGGLSFNLR